MSQYMKGKYEHSLDAKGRYVIPSAFREVIGDKFVLFCSLNGKSIRILPDRVWNELYEKMLPLTYDPNSGFTDDDLSDLCARSIDCTMDNQGRTVLPQTLRDAAGIKKDIVIIGAGERAEIWDKDVYEETKGKRTKSDEELRQVLRGFGVNL